MTHAQKRLKERYSIQPQKSLIHMIIRWIRTGSPKVEFVKKSYKNRGIYLVRLKRKVITVVFGYRFQGIVTFLPEGSV